MLRPPTAGTAGPHPLLLFLHGRGESGPADGSELARAKAHGPLKVAEVGPAGAPGLPATCLAGFYIVNPQCQDAPDSWSVPSTVTKVKGLIDELLRSHGPEDIDRCVLLCIGMAAREVCHVEAAADECVHRVAAGTNCT